jgi:hypothetical protein
MATTNLHSAPSKGRSDDELHALTCALYARLSSGHDRLAFNVDPNGPALTAIDEDGKRRLVTMLGDEAPPPWQRARELVGATKVTQRDGRVRWDGGTTVDRRFNAWVLQQHLRGRYSVAATSGGFVEWGVLDIDAHVRPGESALQARRRAERVLGAVWRAFACSDERHPLVLRSPGGGFHVWFPLTRGPSSSNHEHTWPADVVRAWLEQHLIAAGLELESGTLEVFPCGRALRAPCGAGMVLLRATRPNTPDDLGLVPWEGTTGPGRVNWRGLRRGLDVELSSPTRRVRPMVKAFLGQWDAQRRTLAEWLLRREASWDPTWGFLGWRAQPPLLAAETGGAAKKIDAVALGLPDQSQESGEVVGRPGGRGRKATRAQGDAGRGRARRSGSDPIDLHPSPPERDDLPPAPASGPLVRGRAFRTKVQALLAHGVTEPASRHDAVLVLSFYWFATCGHDSGKALALLEQWCRAHPHHGSQLAARPRAFTRACLREAAHYLEYGASAWPFRGRGDGGGRGTLTTADQVVIAAADARVRDEVAAVMAWLAGRAGDDGRVLEPVQIASGLLARLCGDRRVVEGGRRRRAVTIALEELERLGVLTLEYNYVVGRRGRGWLCWYRFGSGELAPVVEVSPPAWQAAEPIVRAAPIVRPARSAAEPDEDAAARCEACQDEPEGASVAARVIAERVVPDGLARILSDGRRTLPRVLFVAAATVPAARAAWAQRCYRRRNFTPGTFFGGDAAPVPDVATRRRLSRRLRIELGTEGVLPPRATARTFLDPSAVAQLPPASELMPLEVAEVAAHAWRAHVPIHAPGWRGGRYAAP